MYIYHVSGKSRSLRSLCFFSRGPVLGVQEFPVYNFSYMHPYGWRPIYSLGLSKIPIYRIYPFLYLALNSCFLTHSSKVIPFLPIFIYLSLLLQGSAWLQFLSWVLSSVSLLWILYDIGIIPFCLFLFLNKYKDRSHNLCIFVTSASTKVCVLVGTQNILVH